MNTAEWILIKKRLTPTAMGAPSGPRVPVLKEQLPVTVVSESKSMARPIWSAGIIIFLRFKISAALTALGAVEE